jgi:hypothetical protein
VPETDGSLSVSAQADTTAGVATLDTGRRLDDVRAGSTGRPEPLLAAWPG